MTDLEICKRIAEIEKIHVSNAECGMYDPLAKTETGKALCFDLMVEYDVRVEPSDCNAWIDNEDGYPEHEIIHHNGTLQQAICLAIIEANEDKNKTTWLRDSNTHSNKGK